MNRSVLLFLLLFFLLALVLPATLCADTTSGKGEHGGAANAIGVDPLWILFNIYKGSYERKVAGQFSALVEAFYSPDFLWGLHEYSTLTYLDLVGKGRYYIGSLLKEQARDVDIAGLEKQVRRIFTDALGGLYVGAFAGYVNSVVEKGSDADFFRAEFNGFGGGIEAGIKYVFGENRVSFFAEPYVRLQYYTGGYGYKDSEGSPMEKPSDFADGFDRNGVSGGVNFGIVF